MKIRNLLMTATLTAGLWGLSACSKDDGKIKIGILQYATHEALTNAKDGFIDRLAALGYGADQVTFTVKNPEGDPDQLNQMATSFESGGFDLVYGIATPAAIALKNAYDGNRNDGPILFSAVTDAVGEGLVTTNENPGSNITGTIDMNPVAEQVRLLKKVNPDIKKIGVIYTQSENNSVIQTELVKAECRAEGIEVVVKTIGTVNELQTVANALVKNIDALYLPTDNIVAAAMATVKTALKDNGVSIPVCCGEIGMVKAGGLITLGLDYVKLGEQTADMAAKILKGEKKAGEIPVEAQQSFDLVINKDFAREFNLTVPAELLDQADLIIESQA